MDAEEIARRCLGEECPTQALEVGRLVGELANQVRRLQKQVDVLQRWKEEKEQGGNGNGNGG